MTRTLRIPVLTAAVVFALSASGCASRPGDAATVGSDPIRTRELDQVAAAVCAAQTAGQQPGQAQQLSSRSARQLALGLLIDTKLSATYAAARGLRAERQQVERAVASQAQLVSSVSPRYRAVLRRILTGLATSQLVLGEVGRRRLVGAGSTNITAQSALDAGRRARDAWVRKNVDVSVDPRFGTFAGGALRAGLGSLSVPVSSRSVAGAQQQPPSSWVASLPATQKCS